MRRHGWELPYHPLQVVAVAVFLALAFAYYVFFVPFVGKKLFQYLAIGLYSPLVALAFSLYIWCAATDPGDAGVFKSKKYSKTAIEKKTAAAKNPLPGSSTATGDANRESTEGKIQSEEGGGLNDGHENESLNSDVKTELVRNPLLRLFGICSCILKNPNKNFTEEAPDDEMLYCSLCEVEVSKLSKHCRVCDKCVDGFDHHCRWLNNCIGRKNYKGFFVLMVSAFLLLILQWALGIAVLVSCFLNRSRFHVEIISKLGSSFSLVPFIIVVTCCTLLAMIATLPLGQLFFFHILLMKKGISTYDYIIAMREQDQALGGQSPQMSTISSATGMSSASSFNALHRGAWCTPPRLLFEDQFSVLQPEPSMASVEAGNRSGKGMKSGRFRQKSTTVRISPWTLARLNGEEVSRVAAQARRKSKVLQPVSQQDTALVEETDSSFDGNREAFPGNPSRHHHRKKSFRRDRQQQSPPRYSIAPRSSRSLSRFPQKTTMKTGHDAGYDDVNAHTMSETSGSLAPLQMEARNAFCANTSMPAGSTLISSPESSLTSPDIQPFRESISLKQSAISGAPLSFSKGVKLWRSTSDGYEASGGESPDDSDHPSASRRRTTWNALFPNPVFTRNLSAENPHTQLPKMQISKSSKNITECQIGESSTQSSARDALAKKVAQESHSVEEIDFYVSDQDSPEKERCLIATSSQRFGQEN